MVFVEDVRSVPIGRVLKVDGHYAAVKFPSSSTTESNKEDADAWQDCRLMKKDDLQVSILRNLQTPILFPDFRLTHHETMTPDYRY